MWFNCRLFSYKMRENAKIVEIYHGVVISENKSIFLGPIQRWVQQSHTKLLGQRRNACFVFVFVAILFEVDLVGLVFSTRVVIDCGQKKLNYMVARNYILESFVCRLSSIQLAFYLSMQF